MINIPQEIKDLLHQDTCYKNIRIHFPNGERSDICNDLIVMDTVSLKESLCSQNRFKFGLAESPIFECEVVGVSNITNAIIEVYCEVYCDSSVTGAVWRVDLQEYVYPIPYGVFSVQSCERQADILHRKILAYNLVSTNSWGLSLYTRQKLSVPFNSVNKYSPYISSFLFENGVNIDYMFDRVGPYSFHTNDSYTVENLNLKFREEGFSFYTLEMVVFYKSEVVSNLVSDTYVDNMDIARENLHKLVVNMRPWNVPTDIVDYYISRAYGQIKYTNTDNNTRTFYILPNATYPIRHSSLYNSSQFYIEDCIPLQVVMRLNKTENGVKTLIDTLSIYEHVQDSEIYYYYFNTKADYSYLHNQSVVFPCVKDQNNKYYADATNMDIEKVLQSWCELSGKFGYFDANGVLQLKSAQQLFNLTPSQTLYPGENLKPLGVTGGSILPDDYQTCWYDDHYTLPYGKIELVLSDMTYEHYVTGYDAASDPSSYQIYVVSDNMILNSHTWNSTQLAGICNQIEQSLVNVIYMPVKLVGRGLPYVEPGDTFEVFTTANDSVITIVLSRTIKGEMVLTDEYVSVS